MSVFVEWHMPSQVILMRSIGAATLDDFRDAAYQIDAMLADSRRPVVHLILDDTLLTSLPDNIVALAGANTWTAHAKLGWMVRYGNETPSVLDSLLMWAKLDKLHLHLVKDLYTATHFLSERAGVEMPSALRGTETDTQEIAVLAGRFS